MEPSERPLVRETRIGAYGICVNNGRLLVIRKATGPYKGQFDLPGGGIEFGETPEAAVVREFLEETGTRVAVTELIGAFSRVATFVSDTGTATIELHHMGFLYQVVPSDPEFTLKTDPDGLDSLGALWLDPAEADPGSLSPLVVEGLRISVRPVAETNEVSGDPLQQPRKT